MLGSILITHLIGASITFFFIFLASFAILKGKAENYRFYAKGIALLGGFDLISGSILTIVSSHQSTLVFCSRIGLYISILAVSEIVLYLKMKGMNIFPKNLIVISSAFSSLFILAAFFHTL